MVIPPVLLINKCIYEVKHKLQKQWQQQTTQTQNNEPTENERQPSEAKIVLPYAGPKGENIGKEINKTIKKVYDNRAIAKVAYKSKKLRSFFSVKDETEKKHKHNLVYRVTCPECPASYIGEAGRRLEERVEDHGGRDKHSHVLKHSINRGHQKVTINNFTIIGNNFRSEDHRKISEAFFIRKHKPTINIQRLSKPLLLFNWHNHFTIPRFLLPYE